MKALWIFVAFALIPSNLLALVRQKPDQEVIDGIQNLLDQAKALQDSDYQNTIAKIETQFGLRDDKGKRLAPPPPDAYYDTEAGRSMYLRKLREFEEQHREAIRSLVTSDKVMDYAAAVQAHKLETQQADELREKAIVDTINAFDLVPLALGDRILSGPPNTTDPNRFPGHIGEAAEWTLTFSERMPDDKWGETDTSGHTIIGPEAFKNVARLAYTLDHEGRHYRDLTTPGKELWNEPGNEVRLRNETKDARERIFGLSKEDIGQQDKKMWIYRKNAALWTIKKKLEGLDPYRRNDRGYFPGLEGAIPGHTSLDDRLESIRQEALKLEAKVERDAAERAAAQRQEAEDRKVLEKREAEARQEAKDRAATLTRIAFKACHDPDSLSIDDMYSFDWESSAPIGDFPGMMLDIRLLTCVREVFDILMERHSRPSFVDIQDDGRIRYQCQYQVDPGQQLADLAQRACNSPGTLSPGIVKELSKCFPFGHYGSWDGGPDCAHDLYRELLGGRKVPSSDWLANEARGLNQIYAPPPPPPPSTLQPPPDRDPAPRDRPDNHKRCLDRDPNTGIVGCPP